MVLAGEAPVGLADLLLGGPTGHAEDLIVVLLGDGHNGLLWRARRGWAAANASICILIIDSIVVKLAHVEMCYHRGPVHLPRPRRRRGRSSSGARSTPRPTRKC